jgi:hypothetical protein
MDEGRKEVVELVVDGKVSDVKKYALGVRRMKGAEALRTIYRA